MAASRCSQCLAILGVRSFEWCNPAMFSTPAPSRRKGGDNTGQTAIVLRTNWNLIFRLMTWRSKTTPFVTSLPNREQHSEEGRCKLHTTAPAFDRLGSVAIYQSLDSRATRGTKCTRRALREGSACLVDAARAREELVCA